MPNNQFMIKNIKYLLLFRIEMWNYKHLQKMALQKFIFSIIREKKIS